jgi:hypothetical protein
MFSRMGSGELNSKNNMMKIRWYGTCDGAEVS